MTIYNKQEIQGVDDGCLLWLFNILSFRVKDGFLAGDLHMSFKSVFQDVRGSVDYVHMEVGFVLW